MGWRAWVTASFAAVILGIHAQNWKRAQDETIWRQAAQQKAAIEDARPKTERKRKTRAQSIRIASACMRVQAASFLKRISNTYHLNLNNFMSK